MTAYFHFLKQHSSAVFFGWLLTFFSSFGQTFYISLFIPGLLAAFALSNAAFGTAYAAASIIASFFLLRFGHMIDDRPLRPFTYKTILLLSASCLVLGAALHPVMVFVALVGMRLGGQSLMSHISQSVMARQFESGRGKALSFSFLGYSIGELIFPVSIAFLLIWTDWRVALWASSAILLVILLPVLHFMKVEELDNRPDPDCKTGGPDWGYYLALLKEKPFWFIALPTCVVPFITSGLFFYQYVLAETRGWPMEWYAICFSGYAAMRLFFSLYGGLLIDRFTARDLYPYIPVPYILGLLSLALLPGRSAALFFLLLVGITIGANGVVKMSLIAEVYGTKKMGQVRSLFTTSMILLSAGGPVITGFLLDAGFSFSWIALVYGLILTMIVLLLFAVSLNSRFAGRLSLNTTQ